MKVYLNGQTVEESACGEILEPGFLFGWGVFETLRVYKGRPAFFAEHLARLREGLGFLGLPCPDIDFARIVQGLLEQNKLGDAYLRISVFKKRKGAGVTVYASELDYYKPDEYKKGARLMISPFTRYSGDEFLKVKSISYGVNRTVWNIAQNQGKDEAIFLNERGFIQEGTRSNIFFVKNGKVFTPAQACGILCGVTREIVARICRESGIDLSEGQYTKDDLMNAEEIFLTSSLMEIMPVSQVQERQYRVQGYEFVPKLHARYKESVNQQV